MKVSERKALFDMATRIANGNNLYLSHVLESLVEQRKLERMQSRSRNKTGSPSSTSTAKK